MIERRIITSKYMAYVYTCVSHDYLSVQAFFWLTLIQYRGIMGRSKAQQRHEQVQQVTHRRRKYWLQIWQLNFQAQPSTPDLMDLSFSVWYSRALFVEIGHDKQYTVEKCHSVAPENAYLRHFGFLLMHFWWCTSVLQEYEKQAVSIAEQKTPQCCYKGKYPMPSTTGTQTVTRPPDQRGHWIT